MQYYGGGGVTDMHPSLRIYIDCFDSPPFPRAYPRGGGVLDQDPILMQHFRAIRTFEVKWKESQNALADLHGGGAGGDPGPGGLEDLLNSMIEEQELGDDAVF